MIRIGLVGIGGMGTVHYNNYLHIDGCEVVGVVSHSPSGRQKADDWGVAVYGSIEALVREARVDVVDICTPTHKHAEHVREALLAGAHVIVEKPCALHAADAESLYDLAQQQGKHLYVAQVLQFTREMEVLRRLVREQPYGRPLDASFRRLSARPDWAQGGWLFQKEKSGLIPFDLHIHDLDMIISLFGEPRETSCYVAQGEGSDFPELYRWEYSCGDVNVVAEAGWLKASIPFTATWRICFERAAAFYDGQKITVYPYGKEALEINVEDEIKIPTGINVPPTGWYYRELTHFMDCLRRDMDSPLVPREQIVAVLRLLEKAG